MYVLAILIEITFICGAFRVLRESKEQLKYNIESRDNFSIVGLLIIQIALLVTYLFTKPLFSTIIILFICLNVLTALWILINKQNYINIFDKIPPLIDKLLPIAYIVYFGFNLVSPF